MAFFSSIFGNKSPSLTDEEVDAMVREHIAQNPLMFKHQCIINGKTLYTAPLSIAMNNKNIPAVYQLLMKSLELWVIKQEFKQGTPILALPKHWGFNKDSVSIYEFTANELNTTFFNYMGIYDKNVDYSYLFEEQQPAVEEYQTSGEEIIEETENN